MFRMAYGTTMRFLPPWRAEREAAQPLQYRYEAQIPRESAFETSRWSSRAHLYTLLEDAH